MTFIQLNFEDLIRDILADSADERVIAGPLCGPLAPASNARCRGTKVFAFDYALISIRRECFFVGTVELPDTGENDYQVVTHGFRNRFIRTLKRHNFHVVDTSTHLQFAHLCEGVWPCEETEKLRADIENRKGSEQKPSIEKGLFS